MKKLTVVLSVFLGLALGALPAKADNLEDAQLRFFNAYNSADRVNTSSSVAMNLSYVGSSTEAVVTIAVGAITAYAPQGTADTTFGVSAGSYAFVGATYDTFGELCDAIDALASYECVLKGAKRDDNTTTIRDQTATTGTNDLKAVGGFDVYFDTGGMSNLANGTYFERIGFVPNSGKRVLLKSCLINVSTNVTAGSFNVYGKLRRYEGVSDGVTRNDTTLVYEDPTVAFGTDETTTWTESGLGGLEFAKDAHVIVSAGNGTVIQPVGGFARCLWSER